MTFLYYLLEANLNLLIFYAIYRVVLYKLTFHNLTRAYLLICTLLAFVMPFFNFFGSPEVISSIGNLPLKNANPQLESVAPVTFEAGSLLLTVYWCVSFLVFLMLMYRLISIARIIRSGELLRHEGRNFVLVNNLEQPFSFLNYIFLNNESYKDDLIVSHESVHIKQKHSLDLLLFEAIKVVCWFNPLVSVIQSRMKTIHEFIVDKKVVQDSGNKDAYSLFLIHNCARNKMFGLGSAIFNGPSVKERLTMLYSSNSGSLQRIRYCLPVLLLPLMAWAASCTFKKDYKIDARLVADQKKADQVPGNGTVEVHELTLSHFGLQEYDTVSVDAPAFTTRHITVEDVILEDMPVIKFIPSIEVREVESEDIPVVGFKPVIEVPKVNSKDIPVVKSEPQHFSIIADTTKTDRFVSADGTIMTVRKLVLVREDK